MPRVNPESSFEASARHLFRHVNDVKALRANPLLRTYFVTDGEASEQTLGEIHARVLTLAALSCDELQAQGLRMQASRRREIIASLCAGEAPEETAARLHLSRSQYYRERHAVCVEIARALRHTTPTHDARLVVRDDALRLLFRRAESLRDAGRSSEAVRVLEDAHAGAGDDFTKSAIGLGLAEELVFLGRHDRARELLAQSRDLPNGSAKTASEWLRDSRALNVARLESQLGREMDAGFALETLAKRRVAERRSDDVTFSAAFLAGEWFRNAGRYADARAMLRHLQSMDQRLLHGSPKRQIAIGLLAAYCAESYTDEMGLAEQSLRDALELGIASGTLVGALLAMAGLIQHEAARGRDNAAYVMAHEALRMAAGVDFDGFLGYIIVEIAGAVLKTRYWRAVDPLLFEIEELAAARSLARALLKHAQGTFFLRVGRQEKAREALFDGLAVARKLGNRRIEGLILRDRALALSGASAARERSDSIHEAVALLERFGSNDDLLTTYDAAARVLGDRHSLRLARQARAAAGERGLGMLTALVQDPIRIQPLRLSSLRQ